MGFFFKAKLSNKDIFYQELKVCQHKKLLKCLIGDIIDPDILLKNFNDIIKENTTLSEQDINQLNFYDYFLLILFIRYTSIGDLIFAEIFTDKKIKLEISINKLINEFHNFKINNLLQPTIFNNIEVNYTVPNVQALIDFKTAEAQEYLYFYFIKNIKIENQSFNMFNLSNTDKQTIFNKLPVKLAAQIINQVSYIIKELNNFSILTFLPELEEKVYFNLNIENYCTLLKLIFGNDLLGLYDNIFALCKYGNFSPEYIESCTPGEYLFFLKKLEELARKQITDNNQSSNIASSHFEDGLSG